MFWCEPRRVPYLTERVMLGLETSHVILLHAHLVIISINMSNWLANTTQLTIFFHGISQELIICPRNDNDIRDQHPLKPLYASFQQDCQQSPQNRRAPLGITGRRFGRRRKQLIVRSVPSGTSVVVTGEWRAFLTLAARQLWPLTRGVALDWPTVGSTHLRISESTDTAWRGLDTRLGERRGRYKQSQNPCPSDATTIFNVSNG